MSVTTVIAAIVHPAGKRRAVDEVLRLRSQLVPLLILICDLSRRLAVAMAGWDAANAKVSYLGEIEAQLAETTRYADSLEAEVLALRSQLANSRKAGDLIAHPAVTDTQFIPVLTLSDARRWGYLK